MAHSNGPVKGVMVASSQAYAVRASIYGFLGLRCCLFWMQTGNSDDGGGLQDGGSSQKRKTAPLTEEERKKRRKEINRQSARRIRERKSNEMESLRLQVRAPACSVPSTKGPGI